MAAIKPSIGRVVWYYPGGEKDRKAGKQPYSAQIAYVHSDTCINIGYLDNNGVAGSASSVRLLGEGETCEHPFCCWMPYQLGQAAKTEQAEAKAAGK